MHLPVTSQRNAEHQRAQFRALKREHMRRWRAVPANREHERAQQRQAEFLKKLKLLTHPGRPLCGFCYQRPPIANVERLIATERGFRRIFVPYCGAC